MRFIRVNMGTQKVSVDPVASQYIGLGGRGLISLYIHDHVPPTCDPLGPDNTLIIMTGPIIQFPRISNAMVAAIHPILLQA